jgi:hypothetical protein
LTPSLRALIAIAVDVAAGVGVPVEVIDESSNVMFSNASNLRFTSTAIGEPPPVPLFVTVTPSNSASSRTSKYMPFWTLLLNWLFVTWRPSSCARSLSALAAWLFVNDVNPNWLLLKLLFVI